MSTETVQQTVVVEETPVVETPIEEPEKVSEAVADEPKAESEDASETVESTESEAEPLTVAEICAQFPDMEIPENAERALLKQGKLTRKTHFKSSKRMVYLFNDYAIFAKSSGKGKKAKIVLKQLIALSSAAVESKGKSVTIKASGRTFTLSAKSAEEATEWSDLFAAQIKEVTPELVFVEQEVAEEPAKESEVAAEEPKESEPAEKVAEEPVIEEPVAEEPVKESEVAEEPAKESEVAEEPAKESEVAEEPAKESEVVEEPAAEEPVAEVAEEPKESEAVVEETAQESEVEEPAEEEVAEETAEEPVEPEVELTEEQKAVKAVLDQFDAESISANDERVLLKEGDFTMKSNFQTTSRKVYLFNDIAIFAKDGKKGMALKQVVDLSTATVSVAKKSVKFGLRITTPVRNFVFKASSEEDREQWMEMLTTTIKTATLKAQAAAAVQENGGGAALLKAVSEGDVDALAHLIEQKAEFAVHNEEGMTALHVAALKGAVETIKMMAAKGYPLDVVDAEGNTAFARAATQGKERTKSITSAFMEAGAESNAVLRMAAKANKVVSVQALVSSGADMEAGDQSGKAALQYAAEADAMDVAKVLVDAGANVQLRDIEGNTALHLAANQAVADFLIASGARILRNDAGEMPQFTGQERGFVSTACDGVVCDQADWVADNASKSCLKCSAEFTLFNRRHHCRRCGALVCGACSSNAMVTEEGKALRVCDCCVNIMQNKVLLEIETAAAGEQVEEVVEDEVSEVQEQVEEVVEVVAEEVEEVVAEEVVEEPTKESEVVAEEPAKESEEVAEEVSEIAEEAGKVSEVADELPKESVVIERESQIAA